MKVSRDMEISLSFIILGFELLYLISKFPVRKISREDFSIIGHEKDPYLVQVKESIIIKTTRPKLNGNVASVPLHMF